MGATKRNKHLGELGTLYCTSSRSDVSRAVVMELDEQPNRTTIQMCQDIGKHNATSSPRGYANNKNGHR